MFRRANFKLTSTPDIQRRQRLVDSFRAARGRRANPWSRCVTRDPLASPGGRLARRLARLKPRWDKPRRAPAP